MEKLDPGEFRLPATTVRHPVQLSLALGEAGASPDDMHLPRTAAPAGPVTAPTSSTEDGRAQLIEAQTQRAKAVCIILLGLLLFGLRYFDS